MKPETIYGFPRSLITYQKGRIKKSAEGVNLTFKKIRPYLSLKTQSNLEIFTKVKQITWKKVWVFFVKRRRREYSKTKVTYKEYERASILIEGKDEKGIVYQYWRKETAHPGAGQTLLYTEGRKPKQAMNIIGNYANAHMKVKRAIKKNELKSLLTDEDKFVRTFAKEALGEQDGDEIPD